MKNNSYALLIRPQWGATHYMHISRNEQGHLWTAVVHIYCLLQFTHAPCIRWIQMYNDHLQNQRSNLITPKECGVSIRTSMTSQPLSPNIEFVSRIGGDFLKKPSTSTLARGTCAWHDVAKNPSCLSFYIEKVTNCGTWVTITKSIII